MKTAIIIITVLAIATIITVLNQPKHEVTQDVKPGVVTVFHDAKLQHTIDGTILQGGIINK